MLTQAQGGVEFPDQNGVMTSSTTVLAIDGELYQREALQRAPCDDFEVICAANASEALIRNIARK